MTRIVIIGANGQLGTDLVDVLADADLVPQTRADANICDHVGTQQALDRVRPDLVINAAAYNKVDEAESEPELAFRTNALAVWNLAQLSRRQGFRLVHVSTDYVFGGEKRTPYREDDRPNPINVYGVSKLAGEHLCLTGSDRCLVIRTSGLYGVARRPGRADNFVNTMLRLATEERPIRVVNDQTLAPTFTADLARSIRTLALDEDRRGLYHVTNAGECTWYGFAAKVFELSGLRPDVAPINSEEFGAAARRPAYSVLAHSRLREAGVAEPRPWTDAVTDYLTRIGMRRPF